MDSSSNMCVLPSTNLNFRPHNLDEYSVWLYRLLKNKNSKTNLQYSMVLARNYITEKLLIHNNIIYTNE